MKNTADTSLRDSIYLIFGTVWTIFVMLLLSAVLPTLEERFLYPRPKYPTLLVMDELLRIFLRLVIVSFVLAPLLIKQSLLQCVSRVLSSGKADETFNETDK